MAKSKDKDGNGGKAAKGESKRKGKGKGESDEATPYSSVATHPRARASVRRTKAWFGLAGFALAAVLSLKASVPLVQVGERALAAGLAGYMLAWWLAVRVWRALIVAEQHAAYAEIQRRRGEAAERRTAEAQTPA